MGGDADEPRHCAPDARRAGERHGAAGGGGCRLSLGVGGADALERVPLDWATSFGSQGVALMLIADRDNDGAVAETGVQQIEAAYEVLRSAGQERWSANFQTQLAKAQAICDRLGGR